MLDNATSISVVGSITCEDGVDEDLGASVADEEVEKESTLAAKRVRIWKFVGDKELDGLVTDACMADDLESVCVLFSALTEVIIELQTDGDEAVDVGLEL